MERNPFARHKTAVDSTLWWEYQPGQHVMTREGFAGVVTRVEDGPYPGNETYQVRLDGGMGGGSYSPSELKPLAVGRAANVDHTAADDYPELGLVLEERLPLPHTRTAALKVDVDFDFAGFQSHYAGIMDWLSNPRNQRDVALIGGGAAEMAYQRATRPPDEDEVGHFGPFHQRSYDWCRFRKNQRCFFPEHLDIPATRAAGAAVWKASDRGFCPREDWGEQEACTVSEPGPHSGRPDAQPEANINGQVYQRGRNAALQRQATIVAGNDLGFHMLASWSDIQNKARRIRSNGGVRILSSTDGAVVAQVQGDENVYQTALTRVPGKQAVAAWECGCAWSAYSWGRSGRWRKYEGRMCSHALALTWEASARGFGDRPLEDRNTPHWLDPTIPVKVPGDWDMSKGRYASVNDTPDIAPGIVLAAERIADGENPGKTVEALLPLGEREARWLVREALRFEASFPAQYRGRHVMVNITPDGVPVVNNAPVEYEDLLYPTWDPTAGLHLFGAKTALDTGIPDHLTPGPLDKKLVDYKPDRKLSDPTKVVPITSILPQARETVYSKMPFLHHMHESGGMDPEGDTGAYMKARNAFFDSMPEVDVPLDRLVVTQHNVNHERVKQMQDQPETRGSSLPQFVRHHGETWAINGHHRVVQEALDGAPTIRGRLWNLDAGHTGSLRRQILAGADFAPVREDHLGRCYEISAGRVAFGPNESPDLSGYQGARLVHGTIQGYGLPPLEHAWVEEPDGSVYEPGTDHVYDKHDFDRLYNPQVQARYSTQEARRKLAQTQHYGPWHGGYAHMTPDEINATAALPETETCAYCSKQATDRVLHAEGAAYVPVCAEHQARAVSEVGGENEVSGIKPIADLHDEPEPALPETDGAEDFEDIDELPEDKLARRQAGLGWLMGGDEGPQTRADGPASRGAGQSGGSRISDSDIAAAARQHLAKTGAKKFSPAEQARIINEGADSSVRAGNFGDLKLEGTHYAPLEDMHNLDEEALWP